MAQAQLAQKRLLLSKISQAPQITDRVKVQAFFSTAVQPYMDGTRTLNYGVLKEALEETMKNCQGNFGDKLKRKTIHDRFSDVRASVGLLKLLKTRITAQNLEKVYRSVVEMYNKHGYENQFGNYLTTMENTDGLATVMTSDVCSACHLPILEQGLLDEGEYNFHA
jgi:hypothetical protein